MKRADALFRLYASLERLDAIGEAAPEEPDARTGEAPGALAQGIEHVGSLAATAIAGGGALQGHKRVLPVLSDRIGLKKNASTLGETLRRDDHLGPKSELVKPEWGT